MVVTFPRLATRFCIRSLVEGNTLACTCSERFSRAMIRITREEPIGGCRLLCAGSYAITQGGREAQGVPGTHKKILGAGKQAPRLKPPQRGGGTGVLAKSCMNHKSFERVWVDDLDQGWAASFVAAITDRLHIKNVRVITVFPNNVDIATAVNAWRLRSWDFVEAEKTVCLLTDRLEQWRAISVIGHRSLPVDALHRDGSLFDDFLGLLWPRAAIHIKPRQNGSLLDIELFRESLDANLPDVVGESH